MSVSSATTLISPATTTNTSNTMQRSNSHHGHPHRSRTHHGHAHHGHAKRRPSAHSAHTTGQLGTGRRGSEGDGGRKAIFQGLTMAAMDGKGKKAEERPGPKSSRSDSNVLKLRRVTSATSNTSSQHDSRPRLKEKDSEGSVVVVDDDGHEVAVEEGEGDEEWDDEDTPPKRPQSEQEPQEEEEDSDKDPMSQAMRRTMSASVATVKTQSPEEMSVKPASITSPVSSTKSRPGPEAPTLMTRKTTGFSGKHPEPSPEPVEVVPLRRVQSVKELAAEAIGSERKATIEKLAMMDKDKEHQHEHEPKQKSHSGPAGPSRTRSTEGSGMPEHKLSQLETSPSYPFPRVLDNQGLERKASNGLRHIPSNTSIRSTISYRAPPHPLNSSLGYHAGQHARTASTALTVDTDMRRSMHQPPLAPPVINREAAEGHTWDLPESQPQSVSTPPPMSRRESTSSQRSLRAIFQPTSSRMQMTSGSNGPAPPPQNGPIPNRRPTAMEAAAAASKLHTTTNQALYHKSLGYSTASAETAHLISRFLPAKKTPKPRWILTAESDPDDIGIPQSEYRESHDALLRQMKEMGMPPSSSKSASNTGSGFRKASRYTSNLLTVGYGRESSVGMGIIKSKNGPLQITRGGWRGKTPFDLSVERCLAQRPRTAGM